MKIQQPTFDPAVYAARRRRFMDQMKGGTALIFTSPERTRSHDTEHVFRPDSDFFYLTGFREPGAALLLIPGHADHEATIFLRPKDPTAETWTGRRLGAEAAPGALGVDRAYPIDELPAVFLKQLPGIETFYYRLGHYPEFDQTVLPLVPKLGSRHVQPPHTWVDPSEILHELRLRKHPEEAALMRQAAAITAEGYQAALAAIRPGAWEFEVQAALDGTFRRLGGNGPAYNSIVAGGDNATILHYTENDQLLKAGELLLIDAGAEYGFYACDVTRTYPINGTFTDAQKAIYELVLKSQLAAIAEVKVGNHVKTYHHKAIEVLTRGMVELGLLQGEVEHLIQSEAYRKFYMHGTGHFLGGDVHDVGRYMDGEAWRPIEAGMVFTVEPGLYVPLGTPGVDPAFHGIGVRIEDDVLVTRDGHEILTAAIPKTVADVEAAMAAARRGEPVAR